MFWKKVVILISFLFTAKRTLMMSSSHSRSGSRSRSRARSRGPTRRRSPRSRVHRDLKENVYNALVPVSSTRHATEESSDIVLKVDDERLDDDELE